MYKKTITYTDYNGEEVTETFYFNFSKAELFNMELSVPGGYSNYINTIVEAKDVPTIVNVFKELILKSYGEKDPSGKRFIKNDALTEAFVQSPAYSELYMELVTNSEAGAEFIKGILPDVAAVAKQLEKMH